jgi:hypothetical protein
MAEAKRLDDMTRWELAALWLDVIHTKPDLFEPLEKKRPPLVAFCALKHAVEQGAFRDDVGSW